MTKSKKLNGYYIDSTSMIHNKVQLNNILDNNIIYDSGSNANGSWIKYANGRMECIGTKNAPTVTTITFAQPFINVPKVVAQVNNAIVDSSNSIKVIKLGTITNIDFKAIAFYWFSPDKNFLPAGEYFDYIAIGKWK